jgi:hypothetical protein
MKELAWAVRFTTRKDERTPSELETGTRSELQRDCQKDLNVWQTTEPRKARKFQRDQNAIRRSLKYSTARQPKHPGFLQVALHV